MKHSTVSILLITMMILTISLVANGNELYGKPTVTVAQRLTVTRNAQGRASVLRIQRPKLFVGKPHKVSVLADDWGDDILDADDVITSYRRRDLTKIEHEDGISDKVRWRLFLARQLAMLKYRELHG
jgi:hypothetical protein